MCEREREREEKIFPTEPYFLGAVPKKYHQRLGETKYQSKTLFRGPRFVTLNHFSYWSMEYEIPFDI